MWECEMSDKNPVGRPRKIKSPEEFDSLVDSYLAMCRANEEPILLTGMILALGLCSKEAFYLYETYPEFLDSVKRARMLVESEYEKRLNVNSSAAGPIFALKNFGWKDKVEQEMYGKDGGPVQVQPVLQIVTS
jgi:hypothetical protein